MLKGLLMCAMLGLAYGVLYLIYGKKGMAIRKYNGKKNIGLLALIALMLIFWALGLSLWIGGIAAKDIVVCIVITFLVPLIIALWAIIARNRIKNIDFDYSLLESASADKGDIENVYICPRCGAAYGTYNLKGKICPHCNLETTFSGYSSESWYRLSRDERASITNMITTGQ